jgi:hypothetical protein
MLNVVVADFKAIIKDNLGRSFTITFPLYNPSTLVYSFRDFGNFSNHNGVKN